MEIRERLGDRRADGAGKADGGRGVKRAEQPGLTFLDGNVAAIIVYRCREDLRRQQARRVALISERNVEPWVIKSFQRDLE